jgi:hypothetical protein
MTGFEGLTEEWLQDHIGGQLARNASFSGEEEQGLERKGALQDAT